MKQVTEQYLLDISYEEYKGLGYFDSNMVERVWEEAGRVKPVPYSEEGERAIYGDIKDKYSNEGIAAFKVWLKEQNATYYADAHENFFIFKAIALCLKEGNKLVYVEDMS